MKITYLSNSIIPSKKANSIHVMNMCEAYASLGHEVNLLCPAREDALKLCAKETYEYYGVGTTFNLTHLPFPSIRFGSAAYIIACFTNLLLNRPSVAIGRYIFTCSLAVALGIDTIFDTHAPIWNDGRIASKLFRRLIRSKHLKHITTNSEALKDLYLKKFPELQGRITALQNGAKPIGKLKTINNWPGRKNTLQIGYVGSLYAGRGVDIIIECARSLPEYDFHIVGGDKKDIVILKERYSGQNLFLHGHKAHSETANYRSCCNILLSPYQRNVFNKAKTQDSSQFMSPIKVIEYLSSGKAIIASDLPAIREILNESTAILVEPDKPSDWVKAIELLASSTEMREKLARNGQSHFEHNLTWLARARKSLNTLEQTEYFN